MSDIDQVLEERGSNYGKFQDHAALTQGLKLCLTRGPSWNKCTSSQKEALEMVVHKIGRIVNGDPNYLDSWVDIIGYTQLVVDELEGKVR